MYFNECPHCGANLDPGEKCDCQERKERQMKLKPQKSSAYRALRTYSGTRSQA